MAQHNRFVICNSFAMPLTLNIEPEGVWFPLPKGEEVMVTEVFEAVPFTVKLSSSDKGELIVSIWPGDGELRVEKCGVDVLDLIQKAAGV